MSEPEQALSRLTGSTRKAAGGPNMSSQHSENPVTIAEAAQILGVHRMTAHRMHKQGRMPFAIKNPDNLPSADYVKLKEIVQALGENATSYDIRTEAERQGLTKQYIKRKLHTVRDRVFPNRTKRPGPASRDRTPSLPQLEPQCQKCGSTKKPKPWGHYVAKDGTQKRTRKCLDCGHMSAVQNWGAEGEIDPRRMRHIMATEKLCTKCGLTLPVACFGKKAGDSQLYRSACNECLNRARSEHYYRTRDRVRFPNGHPKAKEKREGRLPAVAPLITTEQYDAMVVAQGDRCAICRSTNKGKRYRLWCADHCHKTGKIRGLLCGRCNLALGGFLDRVDLLETAASYLRQHLIPADNTDDTAALETVESA
jgi:hypothetical protein